MGDDAASEMGIDPKSDKVTLPHIGKTCSFVKEGATRDGVYTDNMVDALLTFWAAGSGSSASIGGFKHVTAATTEVAVPGKRSIR